MAYGTTAGLSAYATLTGQAIASGTDLDVALYNGNAYINGGTYWRRYIGEADSLDAAFPRDVVELPIPDRVVNATYEAAILWSNDATALSVVAAGQSMIKKEKVDVIEVEYQDAFDGQDALAYAQLRYSVIEDLLTPYLVSAGGFTASAFVA